MKQSAHSPIPSHRAGHPTDTYGFTLIEVVLALGILAFMLTIGWGALRNVAESRKLLNDRQTIDLIGDSVVTRLVRELQLATNSLPLMPPSNSPNTRYGSQDSFLGESSDGERGSSISFLALEGGQYLPDGGRHSGVVQIAYRVFPTPPEERRPEGSLSLVRSEMPYIRPFTRAYEKEMVFPITHDLAAVTFEFYDQDQSKWTKSWSPSTNNGIPAIIRLSFTARSPTSGRTQSYTTEVALAR